MPSPTPPRPSARAAILLAAALAVVALGGARFARAQFPAPDSPPAAAEAAPAPDPGGFPGVGKLPPRSDEKELSTKRDGLLSLLRTIRKRESELELRRQDLANPRFEGRRDEVEQQIKNLTTDLDLLDQRFKELASGVEIESDSAAAQEFDWAREVKDLLGPAINELKRVTTRPREMDRLRREIEVLTEHRQAIQRAEDNLTRFTQRYPEGELAMPLAELGADWEARRQEVDSELEYNKARLDRLANERHSLSATVENLAGMFFRSRGRNLLFASLALVGFWVVFRYLQTWVERLSPFHRRGQTAAVRIFNLTYSLFTGLGAVAMFLYVLYLAGDWVLLTITGLFLFGIAWASKAALPRFWEQTMMLLNLGSVREGERVIFNGLPWRVRTLSFYTHLENPELAGGDVRLPIRAVFGLTSRQFESNEPWFPTHSGEWVLLDGGIPAQVMIQTPEFVTLRYLGGAERTVIATSFVALNPTVLSRGFRLASTFGVDYRHQPDATTDIPTLLTEAIQGGLEREGFGSLLRRLSVEIQEAAASSLNLLVQADFGGDAAASYTFLGRFLQRCCIDAATANGWVIPFPQLTIHRGDPREAEPPGESDVPSTLA